MVGPISTPQSNVRLKDSNGTGAKYLNLATAKWEAGASNGTIFKTTATWEIDTTPAKYMRGNDTTNQVSTDTSQDTTWQRDWGDTQGAAISHGSKYLSKDGSDNAVLATSTMAIYYETVL